MASCCSETCLASSRCAAASIVRAGPTWRSWQSPDPTLRRHGVRYLQLGGDTWNRCGPGWLNADGAYDAGDGTPVADTIVEDVTGRLIMHHEIKKSSRLPFANASLQMVYSEHMLEHMLPLAGGGVNFLRESWRVLAPGGLLRIVTPDLAKYVCGLTREDDGFLSEQARRFPPMESLAKPPSRANVINNIFRNYGHEWLYSFEELVLAAGRAAIPIGLANVCRSDRAGHGLPRWAMRTLRRANQPTNRTHVCWLDQEVRAAESMYVNVYKLA